MYLVVKNVRGRKELSEGPCWSGEGSGGRADVRPKGRETRAEGAAVGARLRGSHTRGRTGPVLPTHLQVPSWLSRPVCVQRPRLEELAAPGIDLPAKARRRSRSRDVRSSQ